MRIPIAVQLGLLVLLTTVFGIAVLAVATVRILPPKDRWDRHANQRISGSRPTISWSMSGTHHFPKGAVLLVFLRMLTITQIPEP